MSEKNLRRKNRKLLRKITDVIQFPFESTNEYDSYPNKVIDKSLPKHICKLNYQKGVRIVTCSQCDFYTITHEKSNQFYRNNKWDGVFLHIISPEDEGYKDNEYF